MNNKTLNSCPQEIEALDLAAAVEQFVARGGVIDVVSDNGCLTSVQNNAGASPQDEIPEHVKLNKLETLKSLVAKGAGISALQYSLRMNRKDIKQLASEHGVKIEFSRPVGEVTRSDRGETADIDDTVAGHAMHYSSLGYTAPEIANILGVSIRDVWNIGKAYRIEFRCKESDGSP